MTHVVVHIDRLVLNGFDSRDQAAVAAGLRGELARLLLNHRDLQQLVTRGDQTRVAIGAVRVAPGAVPSSIGKRAAQGILGKAKP